MSDVKRRLAKLERQVDPPERVRIYFVFSDGTTSDGGPRDPDDDAKVVTLTIGGIDLQHDL